MNKTSFWIYLEPYTFIFKGKKNKFLLYNSASFQTEIFKNEDEYICKLLDQLVDINNMYVISIDSSIITSDSFNTFLYRLRNNHFGDLIEANSFINKPILFPPIGYVKNSITNIKKDRELMNSNVLFNSLSEITIYLNGICALNCRDCNKYHKQFLFCTKSPVEVDSVILKILISTITSLNNKIINICGGDILKYPYLDSFLESIKSSKNKIYLYIHFMNINFKIHDNPIFKEITFVLLVNLSNDITILPDVIEYMKRSTYSYRIHFIVESDEDLVILNGIDTIIDDDVSKVLPFYNNNDNFFTENVFVSYDEILSSKISKEMIFINQLINSNNFGKLKLFPDGSVFDSVFDNMETNSIGNIKDNSLQDIVNRISPVSAWFKLRMDVEPCGSCEFNSLCPPLSTYEAIIGKNNLCSMYPFF